MSKLLIFVSATIVLIFSSAVLPPPALAAPRTDMPEPSSSDGAESTPLNPSARENLTISPAPAVRPRTKVEPGNGLRYYAHRQALTFRAGLASDFPKIKLNDGVLGFQYLFPKFLSPKLEAGADLHQNGRGHVHAGVRWVYFERSYFRPSAKLGLDHYVDAKYGLGTLARKEDWFIRGSGTVEQVVWNPYSLRLECEMLVNFDHTALVLTLGISHGW